MKAFRLFIILWAFVACLFLNPCESGSAAAGGQNLQAESSISFRWAFGALVGDEKKEILKEITRDTTLCTGDRFKMFVELRNRCFVYLIYHSSQGEVYTLFPYNLQQFDNDYEILKKYYIPHGDMWFELDENVGLETFHLLASACRLIQLETLLSDYASSDPGKRPELAKRVLAEIKSLKKQNHKLTAFAERPVLIGGSVRSIGKKKKVTYPDLATMGKEISTDNFYSRTFTIEHQ